MVLLVLMRLALLYIVHSYDLCSLIASNLFYFVCHFFLYRLSAALRFLQNYFWLNLPILLFWLLADNSLFTCLFLFGVPIGFTCGCFCLAFYSCSWLPPIFLCLSFLHSIDHIISISPETFVSLFILSYYLKVKFGTCSSLSKFIHYPMWLAILFYLMIFLLRLPFFCLSNLHLLYTLLISGEKNIKTVCPVCEVQTLSFTK